MRVPAVQKGTVSCFISPHEAAASDTERNMKTIEYRVRPVTRYVVTRFESESDGPDGRSSTGSECLGEFDNGAMAQRAMNAMSSHEAGRNPISAQAMDDVACIRFTKPE